ncbi:MAG: KH domain-containing protein [Synechococcales cyanobacterium CRU_2_2]|nr:KH domain-containing protein [Synechococcales cyanobacterium CRU_2_2]
MTTPNYVELTRFLMEPLLDSPEHLKVSTEVLGGGTKVWVRVALNEAADRGRFFGRGGRNIQAVRHILKAAGDNASQQVTLEVFGAGPELEEVGRSRPGETQVGDRPRIITRRDETQVAPDSDPDVTLDAARISPERPKPKLRKRDEPDA